VVGGTVRDRFLDRPLVDWDLEVYGLDAATLRRVVGSVGSFDEVGSSFGVLKLREVPVDISLPRRDSKVAPGHRGFAISAEPELDAERAPGRG